MKPLSVLGLIGPPSPHGSNMSPALAPVSTTRLTTASSPLPVGWRQPHLWAEPSLVGRAPSGRGWSSAHPGGTSVRKDKPPFQHFSRGTHSHDLDRSRSKGQGLKDSSNQGSPSTPGVFQAGQLVLGLLQGCPLPPRRAIDPSVHGPQLSKQQEHAGLGPGLTGWGCGGVGRSLSTPQLCSVQGRGKEPTAGHPVVAGLPHLPSIHPPPPTPPSTHTLGRGKEPVAGHPLGVAGLPHPTIAYPHPPLASAFLDATVE